MKAKIYSAIILLLVIFYLGCVSYNEVQVKNEPLKNNTGNTIAYLINTPTIETTEILHEAIKKTTKSCNYEFKFYDINKNIKVDSESERFYKIVDPQSIYNKEETCVIIYFGEKNSKFNNCCFSLSAATLYIIPFYGKNEFKVTIDIIKNYNFAKRYTYDIKNSFFIQLLIFPFNSRDANKKKAQIVFEKVFKNFLADAQKDKLL